jgi:hypothetical protein
MLGQKLPTESVSEVRGEDALCGKLDLQLLAPLLVLDACFGGRALVRGFVIR